MRKLYLLLISLLSLNLVSAQVSNYTFSQVSGTYTPITGGTLLGSTTSDDQFFLNPAIPLGGTIRTGVGFPIGFTFVYNNIPFDRIGISNNGWVSLGQSTLTPSVDMNTTSSYTALSSTATNTPSYLRSRIAGMSRDLQAQAGSSLRIETIGTAPNRILVVQFTNYKKFGSGGTGDNINFQIRLHETTNIVEIMYGTVVFNNTTNTADVGLGGSVATDFNNRTTTTDWNASTAGTSNTSRMTMHSSVTPPVPGTIFRWTPPTPCTGTPDPGNTLSSVTMACSGVPFNLSVQNNPAVSGLTYQWQSSVDGTTWTNIAGANGPTLTISQTANTYYRLQVTCAGVTGNSTALQINNDIPTNCYCIPPSTSCTAGDIITNVTVGTINNNSTCGTAGYTNYTATVPATELIAGINNPISVTVGDGGTEHVGVWIDYNHDGVFSATEFSYIGSGNDVTISGNITIPANAMTGPTRMRVRVRYNTALTGADACIGYTFGETEDYAVNIVPCVQGTITAQPVNRTISCSGSTTFNVTATGSGLTYIWEYRTSPTAPWQLVVNGGIFSGANTPTLSLTNTTVNYNNYEFRVLISGGCTAIFASNVAKLTVNNLVATVTPSAPVICLGAIQQISITNTTPLSTASAASPALGITIPDDATTTGVNHTLAIAGVPTGVNINAIKIKMNLTHSWVGDMVIALKAPNGQVINLVYALNATGGAGATTGFTNTVIASNGTIAINTGTNPYTGTWRADRFTPATGDPTVPTGPNGYIPTTDTWTAMFDAANTTSVNGNWTLAMYDYYDDFTLTNKFDNWSIEIDYSGGFANGIWSGPAGTIFTDAAATTAYDGVTPLNSVYVQPTVAGVNNYSVVVNNGPCTTSALTIPVTANTAVSNLADPVATGVCEGGNASFTTTATGTGIVYSWQVSTDGGTTWTTASNSAPYSGATTTTLTVSNVPGDMDGYLYRAIASVAACTSSDTTNAVALTVNPNPVVNITAAPYTNLLPGLSTTLTANVSPNAGDVYTWTFNGLPVTGVTTGMLPVDIDGIGVYTVSVTDINGCAGSSASFTIGDSVSTNMFVYPNPNTGSFQVRYYSAPGNLLPRTLNVYDAKGARIYSRSYSIAAPYQGMQVDLSQHGKGIYMVELTDRNGNRIKAERVLVL